LADQASAGKSLEFPASAALGMHPAWDLVSRDLTGHPFAAIPRWISPLGSWRDPTREAELAQAAAEKCRAKSS